MNYHWRAAFGQMDQAFENMDRVFEDMDREFRDAFSQFDIFGQRPTGQYGHRMPFIEASQRFPMRYGDPYRQSGLHNLVADDFAVDSGVSNDFSGHFISSSSCVFSDSNGVQRSSNCTTRVGPGRVRETVQSVKNLEGETVTIERGIGERVFALLHLP